MDPFGRLPEGCISEILSFTSALDASRSSMVSKEFKSAAQHDYLWDRFLPPDYQEIISTSSSPVKYATKKHLYSSLCHSPILIDGGKMVLGKFLPGSGLTRPTTYMMTSGKTNSQTHHTHHSRDNNLSTCHYASGGSGQIQSGQEFPQSFSLNKRNGKKCFMVRARELLISWKGCWHFISHTESRFSEVAKLRSIGWIHIQGKIKTQMLSKNTMYAAYLVFWLPRMDGLKSSNTVIRYLNDESKYCTSKEQFESRETGKIAKMRADGWMEIEMGKFYNGYVDSGEVEAWLTDINSPNGKSGLVIEGIEFRPV